MNPGDMVVCGVSANIVVEDIGLNVPKGLAVPVSGDLAQRSKDLWRLLSQGLIFRCDVSNIVRGQSPTPVPPSPPPVPTIDLKLVEELRQAIDQQSFSLAQASATIASLESEVGRLQAENARLRSELVEERSKVTKLDKLDDILTLLQSQPVRTTVISSTTGIVAAKPDVSDEAPMYIPSQIKSDTPIETPVVATEARSDAGSVAGAAQALRQARRRGQ